MKYLLTFISISAIVLFGFTQTMDPGLKDCLEGNYAFTDDQNHTFGLYLKPSMELEFHGHVYEGTSNGAKHLGDFVMVGKWGADENTVNMLTGTFKNAKEKYSKDEPEYYAYHYQNSGYKGAYDLDKGTIVFMGNTYVRSEGPCSQAKLNENEAKDQWKGEGTESQKSFEERILDDQISDDLTTLVSGLAQFSDNPRLKNLATEMSDNTRRIDEGRRNASIFGELNESDHQVLNFAENTMQFISIGKAIFGIGEEEKKIELSAEQLEVAEAQGMLNYKLRLIYDDLVAIPSHSSYDKKALKAVEERENMLETYERTTSEYRLQYFEYLNYSGAPDIAQFEKVKAKIQSLSIDERLKRIAELQNKIESKGIEHLCNGDVAFKGIRNSLKLIKINVYTELGNQVKVDELKSTLDYNVGVKDALKNTLEAYNSNNYAVASSFSDIVFNHFSAEKMIQTNYSEYDIISNENTIGAGETVRMRRSTVNYVMALGVLSDLKRNNKTQANNKMNALILFQERFVNALKNYEGLSSKERGRGISVVEFKSEVQLCEVIVSLAHAQLAAHNNNNAEAQKQSDNAVQLLAGVSSVFPLEKYLALWSEYNRVEVLVELEEYNEAKELLKNVKSDYNEYKQFHKGMLLTLDKESMDFLNAFIKYKTDDLNGALLSLKLFHKKYPKEVRSYLLEEKIYRVQGDVEKADVSRNMYIELLKR